MGTFAVAFLAGCSGAAVYVLWKIVHNFFFSPLKNYPGPKLWALSRVPWHVCSLRGKLGWTIKVMHDKYGPVVRIGPDELSFISATAWKKIYGQKSPEFEKCLDGRGIAPGPSIRQDSRSIVTEHQKRHGELRHAILPAFSDRALRAQEHYSQTHTDMLVKQLRARVSQNPQDIGRWYSLTTFDIISALAFGKHTPSLEDADQPWLHVMSRRGKLIVLYQISTAFGFRESMEWLWPLYTRVPRAKHMELCATRVKERISRTDENLTDFMSFFLENEKQNLSFRELAFMASAFVVAGTGTTSVATTGTTFFILRNPNSHKRLVKELLDAFPTNDDITAAATNELPFLEACLREGMRMFPPSPSTLPRFVPKGGAEVEGHWLPAQIAVGVHQLSSGLSALNFHRPMEFLPERWLDLAADSPFQGDQRAAHKPFSFGTRDCIGKSLAWQEMRLILAKIFWHFELELVDDSDDWWKNGKTYFVWEKLPVMVNIKPRIL